MSRLHVYTVHIDPSLPHPYEEAQFIEEGFNGKAFIFGVLWALYNRLWLFVCIMLGMHGLILSTALAGASPAAVVCMHLAWHLFVGYSGNDWLRSKFKKQGFITADIVTGDSLLRAEQRFFDRYFASRNNTAFVA